MMYGKIGMNFIKATLTVGLMLSMFKLVIGWYYGYKNIDGRYGGSYFYNWRINHVDPKVAKTFFKPIGLNEQDLKNKILYKYLDAVQGTDNEFMTKSYNFENKEYIKNKEMKRSKLPYYGYGFTDAFVYPSNKNWMLFNNNEKNLDMELEYLNLRGDFISELYCIQYDERIKNTYFGHVNKEGKKINGRTIKKGEFFNEVENKKVVNFFKNNKNFIDAKKISKIIRNIIKGKENYKITMGIDTAKMQDSLKIDVMELVDSIFSEEKLGYKITEKEVNEFLYRVAVIKMRPMDGHILNRIYSFCTMLFSGITDNSIEVPEYKNYIKNIAELKEESKKASVDKDRILRKLVILEKEKNSLRAEIIFVKISQLIASLYGDGIYIIDGKKDKRSFLEKYGSPKLAFENDFKKDEISWKKNINFLNSELIRNLQELDSQ